MYRWIRGLVVGITLAAVSQAIGAYAKEEKVPLDNLPKAVREAIDKKFPGAKLSEASKETEDDKTFFEVELKQKGEEYEVKVTPEGRIIEIEREIDAKDLPSAVLAALNKRFSKAEIKEAEEVTKDGKIASYEVEIVTADKKEVEVTLDPNGKILEEETEDDEK